MEVKYSEYPCLITVNEQLDIINQGIKILNERRLKKIEKGNPIVIGLCRILADIIYDKHMDLVLKHRLTSFIYIERFLPLFNYENASTFANAQRAEEPSVREALFWWEAYRNYDFDNRIAFLEWMTKELKETALFGPRY